MNNTIRQNFFEFYYDFGSPNSFLAHCVIDKIEKKTGYKALYKPVLLGGIFRLTNNQPPLIAFKNVKNKILYIKKEINRFVKNHKIKYRMNDNFPLRTVEMMRASVFLENSSHYKEFINTIFFHIWTEPKKMDDYETFKKIIRKSKLPEKEIIDAIKTDNIKNKLKEYTDRAVEKGIFGLPSFVIDKELFFGKNSIYDLEKYLISKNK